MIDPLALLPRPRLTLPPPMPCTHTRTHTQPFRRPHHPHTIRPSPTRQPLPACPPPNGNSHRFYPTHTHAHMHPTYIPAGLVVLLGAGGVGEGRQGVGCKWSCKERRASRGTLGTWGFIRGSIRQSCGVFAGRQAGGRLFIGLTAVLALYLGMGRQTITGWLATPSSPHITTTTCPRPPSRLCLLVFSRSLSTTNSPIHQPGLGCKRITIWIAPLVTETVLTCLPGYN
ncbi:hypothetical protein DFH27DRAFT_231263 [Peziza echinospora]|nr:hypothetical protein DFH27DRAFT_231263 [Peziza echinospora]